MKPSHHFEPALCQALIGPLPDAVVFADRDRVIPAWNDGAEAVFGFAASEVLGQSLDAIAASLLGAEGASRSPSRAEAKQTS